MVGQKEGRLKFPTRLEFSTTNANYRLYLSLHPRKTKIEDVSDIDALVVETGFYSYDEWSLERLLSSSSHNLIKKNIELDEPRPIFFVDVPGTRFLRKRGIAGYSALTHLISAEINLPLLLFLTHPPHTLPLALPAISHFGSFLNLLSDKFAEINSYLLLSTFYVPSGLSSAISAKKIEENVATEMKKRVGEKPNILIEYGAGHADIKPYLKYKKLRDFVIKLHSLWNFFPPR
jgi:hypothetical protein